MVRHPQPPRQPRLDDIAAQAALQGGMRIRQDEAVKMIDATPAFQYGPLKPLKEGQPRPVYKIETAMGSVFAPTFIILRPYGWLLFSHEEGLRPFERDVINIDDLAISCRVDVTQLILSSAEISISVIPGEEWMLVTKADTEAIYQYVQDRTSTSEQFTLTEFLAARAAQSSDQSADTEGGTSDES